MPIIRDTDGRDMNGKKLIFFFAIIAMFATDAWALDANDTSFTIRPIIQYAWWKPYFESYARESECDLVRTVTSSLSIKNSTFLYGPGFTYNFSSRWSMSGAFVFSIQRGYHASAQYLFVFPGIIGYARSSAQQISRYDAETGFNYLFHRYFAVTFGARSQVHNYSGRTTMLIRSNAAVIPLLPMSRTLYYSIGLDAGFNMRLPLVNRLMLVCAVSAICMPGKNVNNGIVKKRDPFVSYGGSGGLSLAYAFPQINATIAVGGSYQVLSYAMLPGADSRGGRYSSNIDHFYGITANAVFAF